MRKWIVVILSLVIFTSCVSAISTNLKAEYMKGETMIVEISGNILSSIGKEQVEFRRGHVAVPFDYDLKKLGDKYFLWAITRENEEDYTLVIKDITTTVSGKLTTLDFQQNFSVSNVSASYSVKPGFISAKEDFKLEIQLNEDIDKTIASDFPEEREIVLKPGKNYVAFPLKEDVNGLIMIKVGDYSLPALITGKNVIVEPPPYNEIILELNPKILISTILINERVDYPVNIINTGERDIYDVKFVYDNDLFYIPEIANRSLVVGSALNFNVSFIGEVDADFARRGIEDSILIDADGTQFELPIFINFTEEEGEVDTPYLANLSYCSDLQGVVCTAGEVCSGEKRTSLNGVCCLGECSNDMEEGGNEWIGYLIAGILSIGLIIVFLRYRKTKGKSEFGKRVSDAEKNLGIP